MKTLIKKRINSPVNKKPNLGKNSPITNKRTLLVTPSDSSVISVSKKLKNMIEESGETSSEKLTQVSTSTVKRKPAAIPTQSAPIPVKKEKIKKPPSEQMLSEKKPEISEPKEQTSTAHDWTRDEDKVILVEIKSGYITVDELVDRISAKIEGRNSTEIKHRYEFLMDVLQKFQKAN